MNDLMVKKGEWNESQITNNFCKEEAEVILGIPLPRHDVEDKLIWHFSKDGTLLRVVIEFL